MRHHTYTVGVKIMLRGHVHNGPLKCACGRQSASQPTHGARGQEDKTGARVEPRPEPK